MSIEVQADCAVLCCARARAKASGLRSHARCAFVAQMNHTLAHQAAPRQRAIGAPLT